MGDHSKIVTKSGFQWTILILGLLLGMGVGFCASKYRALSMAVLSSIGGYFLGSLVNTIFLVTSAHVYWILMSLIIIVTMVATYFIQKKLIIVLTSFIGSYSFNKGVFYIFGGYWNDLDLYVMITDGSITWDNFPKKYFLFFALIIIFAGIGITVQLKRANNVDKKQDEEDNERSKKELKAYRDKKIK